MPDKTALGNRMKGYEKAAQTTLTRRLPLILRVDGRAFHTYTKKIVDVSAPDPWNPRMRDGMTAAAQGLLKEISGAKLAYVQSDEISVLIVDYETPTTEPWFGKKVQKNCSVAASIATVYFNNFIRDLGENLPPTATFDARVFVLPKEEVVNYFIWRQQDATKNSISMLAQSQFSNKQLHKKKASTGMIVRLGRKEDGVSFERLSQLPLQK